MIGARLFIIAAFAAPVLAGCDNKPVAGGAPPPPPVTVSKPIQKKITEWDEYTGRFEALATVEVRARVSGFIDSIHFRDGEIVQQGALLFIIVISGITSGRMEGSVAEDETIKFSNQSDFSVIPSGRNFAGTVKNARMILLADQRQASNPPQCHMNSIPIYLTIHDIRLTRGSNFSF